MSASTRRSARDSSNGQSANGVGGIPVPAFDDVMAPWLLFTEIWRIQSQAGMDAAEVIARRVLLAATGAMTAEEATRMVMEKPAAFSRSLEALAIALVEGAPAHDALRRAAIPVEGHLRANARRLRP